VATEDRFLNTEEVAEMMQVDEQTIRRWIKAGKLRAFKPGREWKIPQSALDSLQENYSAPKALRDTRTGDERLEDRLAPRVARLENLDLTELAEHRRELEEKLPGLKEEIRFKGATIHSIRDDREYQEVMDELLALITVLERKAAKQLA
jgi:excisionase family DNA binding protein